MRQQAVDAKGKEARPQRHTSSKNDKVRVRIEAHRDVQREETDEQAGGVKRRPGLLPHRENVACRFSRHDLYGVRQCIQCRKAEKG